MRRFRGTVRAFTLVEIMIAVLFICIAFFGYVALHSRILHSGQKLEEKEVFRGNTDLFEGLDVARALLGTSTSVTGETFLKHPVLDDIVILSTDLHNRNTTWIEALPPEYNTHIEETIELAPRVMLNPYTYSWSKR